jgi:hypothetical protein
MYALCNVAVAIKELRLNSMLKTVNKLDYFSETGSVSVFGYRAGGEGRFLDQRSRPACSNGPTEKELLFFPPLLCVCIKPRQWIMPIITVMFIAIHHRQKSPSVV